jgi:hypothetical protein
MRRCSARLLVVLATIAVIAAVGMTAVSSGHSTTNTKRGLVAILGILRRPQTQADLDLGPQRTAALGRIGGGRTPVMSLIRLAVTPPDGRKVFLVPMRPTGHRATNTNLTLAVFAAGGAGCCVTATEIEAHGSWGSGGPPEQLVAIVPDGVAKVSALILRPPDFKHSDAVTATVHHNVVVFSLHRAIDSPGGFIWYGRSGAVLKRIR